MPEATPCQSCPFLRANHGKRRPKGWYDEANVRRLWAGLSEGERLACLELASPTAPPRDCSGALLLVARHLYALRGRAFESYQHATPTPLTQQGVSRWISRLASDPERVALADAGVTLELPLPGQTENSTLGVPWSCPVTNRSHDVAAEKPFEG